MKDYLSVKNRIIVTVLFTVYTLLLILWDYSHGGVPIHYLFESDDLPGISNWWGVLIVPVFSWIILKRISNRDDHIDYSGAKYILLRFLLAAVFGIIVSMFFFSEVDVMVSYLMVALLAISFFFPLYKGEFLLGYVMSTLFAFGTFIPTLGALILMCLLFLFYKIGRLVASALQAKKAI
ncbi:MAG: hypothetical protein AB8B73_06605 [Ekhidna sp.]